MLRLDKNTALTMYENSKNIAVVYFQNFQAYTHGLEHMVYTVHIRKYAT